jgi:hypothetical protein
MSIAGAFPPIRTAVPGAVLPGLAIGMVLDARVVGPGKSGGTEVVIAGQKLNLAIPVPVAPGTQLKLEVSGTTPHLQFGLRLPGTSTAAPAAPLGKQQLPAAGKAMTATPSAATPQVALAHAVQAAVHRQDTVAGLVSALGVSSGLPLPEPVARAARQLLAHRLQLASTGLDGSRLKAAVAASGTFSEAKFTAGLLPLPATDLKAAIMSLQRTLLAWVGNTAAVVQPSRTPPPLKGVQPRARPTLAEPAIDQDTPPQQIGRQLMERAEAALSRVRLLQHASLPDPAVAETDWHVELPVLVGHQQAMLYIHIRRDAEQETQAPADRGWQLRFAFNLPQMGEVGAQVSLRAGTAGIMLWATEEATAHQLQLHRDQLRATLQEAGIRLGSITVRAGEPPTAQVDPGRFVDART